MRSGLPLLCVLAVLILTGCEPPKEPHQQPAPQTAAQPAQAMSPLPITLDEWAKGARLIDGLGDFHRRTTTGSSDAQQYFDQGMRLLWAFNHDESTRSFAKAAQLDPQCALCYWGVALTVGPNYNLPLMAEARAKVAAEALALAQKNMARAEPVEQALIGALVSRYPNARPLDPSNEGPVLVAYAGAMRRVAARFPDDLDVQTLFAESLMTVNAWKLWAPDGKPAPGTPEIVATLERVLARDPRHPGANHYYVHTMEAAPHPEQALAAAGRLPGLMPSAGHLVHMPAHILQRVGRYEEAAQANRQGAAADEIYFNRMEPLDYYPMMYTAHNYQFLAYSAAMEGRRAETLDAVRNSRRVTSDDTLLAMPGFDWPLAEEYGALVRFGLWDRMLERPAPNPKFGAVTGGYLYGRGMAFAAKGRLEEARRSANELMALGASLPADAPAGQNAARDVLAIALALVQARIAVAEHREDEAIALLRDAVAREDRLAYNEPYDWFFPVRHVLGARLLEAGQPAAAESVYREDLTRNRANGWALYGLAAALKRQNKAAQAAPVQLQFEAAWKQSDITLDSSAF
jgi:tetratricopeptide (TPR) repeat protein